MWPFNRRLEPDPLLEGIKKGVLAMLAQHQLELDALRKRLEDVVDARKMEQRLQVLEHGVKALSSYTHGEVDRLDAAYVQVRGLATGGLRSNGRRNGQNPDERRELQAIGERFTHAIGSQEGRTQLIEELQAMKDVPEKSPVG